MAYGVTPRPYPIFSSICWLFSLLVFTLTFGKCRIVDYDDYTIKDDVFTYIDEAWGPLTIDRFIITRNLVG